MESWFVFEGWFYVAAGIFVLAPVGLIIHLKFTQLKERSGTVAD